MTNDCDDDYARLRCFYNDDEMMSGNKSDFHLETN